MSFAPNVAFWPDEDGDYYFCEAHFSTERMRELALEFEEEAGCLDDERRERIEAGTSDQCWIRWNPDDEEAPGERVEPGVPGAVPNTRLSV